MRIGAGAILAACALVSPARAEEPQRARTIEEIVVTAQKREEAAIDVPISMTVVDGDVLRESEIVRFHELVKLTPNVTLPNGTCCGPVFVRGIGTPFGFTAFEPTVGLAIDELPINQNVYLSDPLYDVERVEVLRGPQGTLFGRNATAGLFSVTTAAPTEEFSGHLAAHAGGLGTRSFEGAVGGPLGEVARIRAAVLASRQAGDVENTFLGGDDPGVEQLAGRVKLDLRPIDSVDVLLLAESARTEADVQLYQLHDLSDSSVAFLRGYDPDFEDDGFDHRHSSDAPSEMERKADRAQGNVRLDAGDVGPLRGVEVVAVAGTTGFDSEVPTDFDDSPADVLRARADGEYRQRSAEIRATSALALPGVPGTLDLLAGVFALRASFESDSPTTLGDDAEEWFLSAPGFELVTGEPPPGGVGFGSLAEVAAALGIALPDVPGGGGDGLHITLDQTTTSFAFFGETAWRPSEHWRIAAGARVTRERKRGQARADCFGLGLACAAVGGEEYALDLSRRDVDVSPRFALQWFPSERLSLFATRATGFKSGGFNNVSLVPDDVEVGRERAVSWEVGAKGIALDDTLAWSAALFHVDVDDLQVQNFVGPLVQVRNAASARSRGVELDARWLAPWEPLTLTLAGAYTDARYVDFPNAVAPSTSASSTQDLSGRRMPFVSEWQLTATPSLRLPLVRDLFLAAALDVVYRSDYSPIAESDPRVQEPSHVVLDGRLAVGTGSGWSLQLSVTNLTDARIAEFVGPAIAFPGGTYVIERFQRNWSIGVRYAF